MASAALVVAGALRVTAGRRHRGAGDALLAIGGLGTLTVEAGALRKR